MIVYLLRELTRVHKDLWVKLVDSDGEFLLIEAAGSLPSWLEPEVADNRVGFDSPVSENFQILIHQLGMDSRRTACDYQTEKRQEESDRKNLAG